MKIALMQMDIAWCDERENIARAEQMVATSPSAELYVLPEMWSTGFVIEAQDVARTEQESEALAWMCRTAKTRNCAVAGSLVIREGERYFNRLYFVTAEGILARYDKYHLFRWGGETKRFTAGNERVVVEWRGVRFLLQVCYDVRFPAFSRNRMTESGAEYDVAIYVASWPTERLEVWQKLVMARAIENQAYVVAVNRTGTDAYCDYSGGSICVDGLGDMVADAAMRTGIVVADVDLIPLRELRRRFPTLRDADEFTLWLRGKAE